MSVRTEMRAMDDAYSVMGPTTHPKVPRAKTREGTERAMRTQRPPRAIDEHAVASLIAVVAALPSRQSAHAEHP